MNLEKRRKNSVKIAILVILLVLVGIVIYATTALVSRIGKVKVTTLYAPYAASVKLNGQSVRNNADNYVVPGTYKVLVEYKNFDSYEEEIEINESTGVIYGTLSPINEEGEKYYEKHKSEFAAVGGVAGAKQAEEGASVHKQFPIMSKFPLKEPHYTLSYELLNNDTELKIIIKASSGYRSLAITKLLGLVTEDEMSEYDVEIKELVSPFTGEFTQNDQTEPLKFLQAGYGAAMDGFSLGKGKEQDGYYYGYIAKRVGYVNEIYRFVLKKTDAGWQFCGAPYPVLTGKNTPNVPKEILRKANTGDFN